MTCTLPCKALPATLMAAVDAPSTSSRLPLLPANVEPFNTSIVASTPPSTSNAGPLRPTTLEPSSSNDAVPTGESVSNRTPAASPLICVLADARTTPPATIRPKLPASVPVTVLLIRSRVLKLVTAAPEMAPLK
ncbi:hypothetical protein D3C84_674140 [compost metagenome]